MPEAKTCRCSVAPSGWFGLIDPSCEIILVLDREAHVLDGYPHVSAALLSPVCSTSSMDALLPTSVVALLRDRIEVATRARSPTSVDLTLPTSMSDDPLPFHARISPEGDRVLLLLRGMSSESKRVNQAGPTDDESFWQLFEAAPIPLAVEVASDATSHGGSRLNKKFTSVFGYDAQDVPSVQNWWPLAYPDPGYRQRVRERWFNGVQESLRGSEAPTMQTTVVCKDGTRREIEFGVAAIGERQVVTFIDLTEQKRAERALTARVEELDAALRELRTLRGLLPVCAWCRKLRSDTGYWLELEDFMEQAREVTVTHGICPECRGRHFARPSR